MLERASDRVAKAFGGHLAETLIAWNYMDLLDRDLSQVKLSVTHKRLHELHPADVADILETLNPSQRAAVFEHLDNESAAETISELEDEYQADVIDDLSERRASDLLAEMDPDDAADIIGDLPYDKAERLLRLMGVEDAKAIRSLLGYKEKTAGGIMTPEVTTVREDMTVQEVIECLRGEAAEHESIYYVYVVAPDKRLTGVISLRDLLVSAPETSVSEIAERDLITTNPDDDQEDVAEAMSKYDLLALPVVDESGALLGIVTVDDALDVMEEESAEDLELATGRRGRGRFAVTGLWQWVSRDGWLAVWVFLFIGAAALTRVPTGVGGFGALLLYGVLASPIVLRISEDVASHAMVRIIESEADEERGPFFLRLASDGLSGLALGVVVALAAFTVAWLVFNPAAQGGAAGFAESVSILAAAFGLAVLLVTLAGTVVAALAERRAVSGKRVSPIVVSVSLMLVGEVLLIALLAAALAIISATNAFAA